MLAQGFMNSVYGFQAFLSRTGYRKHTILGQEQVVKFN